MYVSNRDYYKTKKRLCFDDKHQTDHNFTLEEILYFSLAFSHFKTVFTFVDWQIVSKISEDFNIGCSSLTVV